MEREKKKYKVHKVKQFRYINIKWIDMFEMSLLDSQTKWHVEYRSQASLVESHPH